MKPYFIKNTCSDLRQILAKLIIILYKVKNKIKMHNCIKFTVLMINYRVMNHYYSYILKKASNKGLKVFFCTAVLGLIMF